MTNPPSSSAVPNRALGTRIAHIGIAVSDLAAILPFYRDILDLPQVPLDDSDGANIVGLQAGESLVELLRSSADDSPIDKFVKRRGPGIHHICFAVDDLDATLARCSANGIALLDTVPRMGAEGKRIAFLHPRSTGGVLVELTEH